MMINKIIKSMYSYPDLRIVMIMGDLVCTVPYLSEDRIIRHGNGVTSMEPAKWYLATDLKGMGYEEI